MESMQCEETTRCHLGAAQKGKTMDLFLCCINNVLHFTARIVCAKCTEPATG